MNMPSTEHTLALERCARETGFEPDAVRAMTEALAVGGGTMAQFDHPAFGGAGQWMRGGMVMTRDFGDHALKARIDRLCTMLADEPVVEAARAARGAQHQRQSSGDSRQRDTGAWWPDALGRPDATGAQDDTRYAWFAGSRRLAIDTNGRVTVYDTADHRIGGVSQQQSGIAGLSFTSQHGPVAIDRLAVVEPSAAPAAMPASPPASGDDPFAALERLAALHERGIVDDDEYRAKKAELLARI